MWPARALALLIIVLAVRRSRASPTTSIPEADDELRVQLTRRPADGNLTAGEKLLLRCEARLDSRLETPTPTRLKIQWLKNESPIDATDRHIDVKKNVSGESGWSTLRIKSVTVHDRGYYDCVATANGKRRANATAVIFVRDADDDEDVSIVSIPMENSEPVFDSSPPPSPSPSIENISSPEPQTPETPVTLCQPYVGTSCVDYLHNHSVYVPFWTTQAALEQNLTRAFSVISFSNEISTDCSTYAQPSLCFSTFPICKTPEVTNREYLERRHWANFGNSEFIADVEVHIDTKTKTVVKETRPRSESRSRRSRSLETDFSRSSIPLRRVCQRDCEILENELCQKEYAIAKRHPEIGKKLTLEKCDDLPADAPDCLEIGVVSHVDSYDACYWETGLNYEGNVDVAASGLPCIKWSHQFVYKITDNRELMGGHNFCRNPGGGESQPWCYVERGDKLEKQLCDVPKCSRKIWIFIISAIAGAGVLFLLCALLLCRRHQNSKNDTAAIRNINLPNADKNIYGNSRMNSPIELDFLGQNGPGNNSASRNNKVLRVPNYGLSRIKFIEELGEGAFGKVYKGELDVGNDTVLVAVKALKENASPKTQSDFKREIDLISELRHENVVCILGVVLREEPLCMLFEFMAKGDLHEFLVGKAPPDGSGLTSAQFLSIALHIACGMEYLAAHHYVHRDLAARNCLVADNLVVKISDFGLSRDIYSSDYYRVQSKSLLPVRWMPPESILYGKFTTESDVWSYGVVLWEIYSYGLQPYYGYSNQEVISMVRGRELLQCPSECPRAMYNLMRECWHQTSAKRPNFTTISNRLREWKHSNIAIHCDNTSDSSSALSSHRPPHSIGDPKERVPLISHHSSSNGSLAGSMPRKLSTAGSNKSHASTRLMMSSSDVTSSSDNCENSAKMKKLSCGSLLDDQTSNISSDRRDNKMSNKPCPF